MAITRITLENFTVFDKLDLSLSEGINVFIGENGTGKTHIMKLIYSACQSTSPKVSFSHKIVKCFAPDDYRIGRLTNRKQGNVSTTAKIFASVAENTSPKSISISFSYKTKKWEAEVKGEELWEKQLSTLNSIFIPAKEILSNTYNLSAAVEKNNVSFDDTYIDIINSAKIDISAGRNERTREQQLRIIEDIIDGKVFFDSVKDEFYLKKGQSKLEFNLVAEGVRKIALLWQLIKNGTLEKGAVLFWDEPEANINPVHIPILVEMLLELQNSGVQIFIATHDYFLAKYFEAKMSSKNKVLFHSLYKNDGKVECESSDKFTTLENNPILAESIKLYKAEIKKVME